MAVDLLDIRQISALRRHELMVHGLKMLADDVLVRRWDQVMDIRHPAGQGIFDWDHSSPGQAFIHRGEGILKGAAWQGVVFRQTLAAGQMGIGTELALKGHVHVGIRITV